MTGEDFPVRLQLPSQALRRTFRNASEAHKYLNEQSSFWAQLGQRINIPVAANVGQQIWPHGGQQAFQSALTQVTATSSAAEYLDVFKRVVDRGAIFADGKQGKLLARLADVVPGALPLVAVAYATQLQPNLINSVPSPRANSHDLLAAVQATQASHPTLAAERAQLDALLADATSLKFELEATLRDIKAQHEAETVAWEVSNAEFVSGHKDALTATAHQLEALEAKVSANFTNFMTESNTTTEAFKKRVRQDVVSEVPTTFWNSKATAHAWVAAGAGLAFLAVAAAGVMLLATHGVPLVSDALREVTANDSGSAVLALVPLAFITIPALAFAWFLRHISRVLVQNLSLGADARLRGTITSTFRALVADRPMSDAELAIALQALFRPMDGKDHAEIAPPNLADLLKLDK